MTASRLPANLERRQEFWRAVLDIFTPEAGVFDVDQWWRRSYTEVGFIDDRS